MANTVNFSVRIDSEIKQECERIYNEIGMTLTTAINVFLRQSIRDGGLPFEAKLSWEEQKAIYARLEAERQAGMDEAFEDLKG